MRFNHCTWLGEISYCSSLTVLPGPAWVLLNKICIAIYVTTFYFTLQFFVPRVDMISEAKPRKLCNPRTIKL